jgi:hypothetical protein
VSVATCVWINRRAAVLRREPARRTDRAFRLRCVVAGRRELMASTRRPSTRFRCVRTEYCRLLSAD